MCGRCGAVSWRAAPDVLGGMAGTLAGSATARSLGVPEHFERPRIEWMPQKVRGGRCCVPGAFPAR